MQPRIFWQRFTNDSEEIAASILRAEGMSSETVTNFHHTTGVTLQKASVFIVTAIIPLYISYIGEFGRERESGEDVLATERTASQVLERK
jgi:hypothetical protein